MTVLERLRKAATQAKARSRRGFLLMIVVCLLGVLLMLCLGFLAFAHSEVNSVAHLRDKSDCQDLAQSAIDWMAGNIANELCSGGNTMDPNRFVTLSRSGGHWWYKPFEPGFTAALTDKTIWPSWNGVAPPCLTPADEAQWIYLPADYLPEGGAAARFSIQVLDPNCVPNLNDWLDDCNPTQCQMAHMIMDGYGEQQIEMMRSWRDGGPFDRSPAPDYAPLRYHEAWRVATRTVRYMHWPFGMINTVWGNRVSSMLSPNWITTNTSYVGLYGAEMNSLKPLFCSDGMALPGVPMATPAVKLGPANYFPPTTKEGFTPIYIFWDADSNYADPVAFPPTVTPAGGAPISYHGGGKHLMGNLPINMPFSLHAYTDPDTGRSPVNVNTCYNSGDKLPCSMLGPTPTYAMEAVFNIESLRRIIKIGTFYEPKTNAKVSTDPAAANYIAKVLPLAADRQKAWQKHEDLRTKLAFQYQETLCLYFTGTYNHSKLRKYPPLGAAATPVCGVGAASSDYSKPRFPMGVKAFQTKVLAALTAMATPSATVNFDSSDNADVAPGQLDGRTANAVWDNIVPGKPTTWPSGAGGDPLTELYNLRLGRDELRPTNTEMTSATNPAWSSNVHGFVDDNATLRDSGYGGGLHLRPKGTDIALKVAKNGTAVPEGPYDNSLADIPYRQLCFGPDWFSTELTTSTTTFVFVINAQIIESRTAGTPSPNILYATQWGVCVEIAPDITMDIPQATNLNYYANGVNGPASVTGVGSPGYYKTQPVTSYDSMDKNSFISNQYGMYKTTVSPEWDADVRGITPANASTFYGTPNQTKKRVYVRAVWSLTDNSNR